jgi:hypothetical protein
MNTILFKAPKTLVRKTTILVRMGKKRGLLLKKNLNSRYIQKATRKYLDLRTEKFWKIHDKELRVLYRSPSFIIL